MRIQTAILVIVTSLIAPVALAATLENKFIGIEKPLLNNVAARLKTQQQSMVLTKDNIRELYQDAPEQIKIALQPFGYFKPQIAAQLTELSPERWLAAYHIAPGPQLKITQLQVKLTGAGKDEAAFVKFLTELPLHKGDPLLTEQYRNAKLQFFTIAQKLGYLDAQLTKHLIKVNLERYTADIILHFDTGHRYYFGKVKFSKNPLSPRFLQRFVPFREGQPYSSEDILILQKNLNDSNFYQQALVKPNRQMTYDYHVPLEVSLIPLKPQQYSFGVGYGTDTGPRASIGWDWRYLTDTGHHFSSLLRLSPVQNTLQAAYIIPGKNPLTDQYNINASLLKNQLPRGDNIISKTGAASISKLYNWQQTVSLSFQRERYRFLNQTNYSYSKLLLPSITFQRTEMDNALYPLHGYRTNITLQAASQSLYSDTSLMQLSASGKYIHRVAEKGRILLRADAGYTTVHDSSTELPLSLSFFAGGSRSVRGYAYQALGPGRYLLVGSAEYQHQIIKNWNAAVFFDMGNAFQNMPQTQHLIKSLQQGAGIGVVWISPVGPINLSVAKAINWPGQPMQIQFSMGPDL